MHKAPILADVVVAAFPVNPLPLVMFGGEALEMTSFVANLYTAICVLVYMPGLGNFAALSVERVCVSMIFIFPIWSYCRFLWGL